MKELTQLSLTIIIFLTIISCEDFLTVHPLGFASSSNLIHSEQGITQLLHRVYDPDQGLENYEEGSFNTKGIGMDSRKDAQRNDKVKTSLNSDPRSKNILSPTLGGQHGEIIKVNNLNSEGPGSLRTAVSLDSPRIIVFEVAGVIDLKGNPISIQNPFVTISGQTAPSPGITLIRGGISITTHDVILQHLKIRPGDGGKGKGSG